MNFGGLLLIVKDINKSKKFYCEVLNQTITMDFGEHVSFEKGFGLQENYSGVIGKQLKMVPGANNFQMYFEVADVQAAEGRLKELSDIDFLHYLREYEWGQQSFRIYDVDRNIVEIAESMDSVIVRFLKSGLSVEETAERTMFPDDYVRRFT